MAIKVTIIPDRPYLRDRLQKAGVIVVEKDGQVLHYFGDSIKEVRGLIKKNRPDLVISHNISLFSEIKTPQAYHPWDGTGTTGGKVWTNCLDLTRKYYLSVGLIAQFAEYWPHEEDKESFVCPLCQAWDSFKKFMYWK